MLRYKSKYKKVGVLPIRIVKSYVSSVGPSSERNKHVSSSKFLSDEGPTLETLDFIIHTNFLYFDSLIRSIPNHFLSLFKITRT